MNTRGFRTDCKVQSLRFKLQLRTNIITTRKNWLPLRLALLLPLFGFWAGIFSGPTKLFCGLTRKVVGQDELVHFCRARKLAALASEESSCLH